MARYVESMSDEEKTAEIRKLRDALRPFAAIPLWRDTYPDADHDRIDGPDLCVTMVQVRTARDALQ